jgi:acyl-CoA thioesterase
MTIQIDTQTLAQRCAHSLWVDDKSSRALGMSVDSVTEGHAVLSMTVREDMVNGLNICHGGMIFMLADSAFAYACNSQNQAAVAAGAVIDFLAPAFQDDVLTATATMIHQGGRAGIYSVSVANHNGEPVALFKGNSARIKRSVLPNNDFLGE